MVDGRATNLHWLLATREFVHLPCRVLLGNLKGMEMLVPMPMQKIFFGPPGCGKSYRVRQEAESKLNIAGKNKSNLIETTFHPEYGYGDFVAKLLPQSREVEGKSLIEYRIHAGPLIKALARAYAEPQQSVLLVIDEINRGNCAQIFGDIFQLLDRDDEGRSEYGIDPSDLIKAALKQELEPFWKRLVEKKQALEKSLKDIPNLETLKPKLFEQKQYELKLLEENLEYLPETLKAIDGNDYKLHLLPNLSLIGTMNTSDESVYYMDTAFKRRWDFEYMPWGGAEEVPDFQMKAKIEGTDHTWHDFLGSLNRFIAFAFNGRNLDDKQVGIWFLKTEESTVSPEKFTQLKEALEKLKNQSDLEKWKAYFPRALPYTEEPNEKRLLSNSIRSDLKNTHGIVCVGFNYSPLPTELAKALLDFINEPNAKVRAFVIAPAAIKNKLLFFLWDNVFSRNRTPLHDLLEKGGAKESKPVTFGDFSEEIAAFIDGVMKWKKPSAKKLDGKEEST